MTVLTDEEFIDSPWVHPDDCVKCEKPYSLALGDDMVHWCFDCTSEYLAAIDILNGPAETKLMMDAHVKQPVYEEFFGALMKTVRKKGWAL